MRRDLSGFLRELEERLPHDLVRVERAVAPVRYEVTAILQHLENDKKFPALILSGCPRHKTESEYHNGKDFLGYLSQMPGRILLPLAGVQAQEGTAPLPLLQSSFSGRGES